MQPPKPMTSAEIKSEIRAFIDRLPPEDKAGLNPLLQLVEKLCDQSGDPYERDRSLSEAEQSILDLHWEEQGSIDQQILNDAARTGATVTDWALGDLFK